MTPGSITTSAIIPARNEEQTVAAVVDTVKGDVDEVLVVDSVSTDRTAERAASAGATVVRVETVGKHHAIRAGIRCAHGTELVFLDADLADPPSGMARQLLTALRSDPDVAIAKAYYQRPLDCSRNGGGRLTELCAKPLLSIFLPSLASVQQPLAGEFAVRRTAILDMKFAPGFAVDLGVLIHCARHGRIVQVNLGTKIHKHRPLEQLRDAALQVAVTILRAAGASTTSGEIAPTQFDAAAGGDVALDELRALAPDGSVRGVSTSDQLSIARLLTQRRWKVD